MTDGRDVYGVTSRVLFPHLFGEETQLPRRRMVTYCPNFGAGGGCCYVFFRGLCTEVWYIDRLILLGALFITDGMICLICSGFRIGVLSEDVASGCFAIAAIVFGCLLPCPSFSSDPLRDGAPGVVGLGALSSVTALSNSSPSDERSRFSARGSILFALLVSI